MNYWQSLPQKIIMPNKFISINLWNFPPRHLLCNEKAQQKQLGTCASTDVNNDNTIVTWKIFEDVNFENSMKNYNQMKSTQKFIVTKSQGMLSGLLTSIRLFVDNYEHYECDSWYWNDDSTLQPTCHWPVKFISINPSIEVCRGDEISVQTCCFVESIQVKYSFSVIVTRKNEIVGSSNIEFH